MTFAHLFVIIIIINYTDVWCTTSVPTSCIRKGIFLNQKWNGYRHSVSTQIYSGFLQWCQDKICNKITLVFIGRNLCKHLLETIIKNCDFVGFTKDQNSSPTSVKRYIKRSSVIFVSIHTCKTVVRLQIIHIQMKVKGYYIVHKVNKN